MREYYTQHEYDEMIFVVMQLTLTNIFKYTDDENDILSFDRIVTIIKNKFIFLE